MKQIHNFNPETGVYTHSSNADIDPKETQQKQKTKLKEKRELFVSLEPEATPEQIAAVFLSQEEKEQCEVYLLPAYATDKALPSLEENEVAVFQSNDWQAVENNLGETVYNEVNGEASVVDYLGAIKPGYVTEKPDIPLTAEQMQVEIDAFLNSLDVSIGIEETIAAEIYDEMSVAQRKVLKTGEISKKYQHAMGWILDSYTEEEINSWPQQYEEAVSWQKWLADNPDATDETADYSASLLICEMAKGKNGVDGEGLTINMMNERCEVVMQKAAFFKLFVGGVIGTKKRLQLSLDAISEETEIAKNAVDGVDTSEILAVGLSYLGL